MATRRRAPTTYSRHYCRFCKVGKITVPVVGDSWPSGSIKRLGCSCSLLVLELQHVGYLARLGPRSHAHEALAF